MTTDIAPSWYAQPRARTWRCSAAPSSVYRFHAGLPNYAATPLTELPSLATELGVKRVFVKDESTRLGLAAFKVLGVSYAICRVLADATGHPTVPTSWDGLREQIDAFGRPLELVTATDGNHGHALAHIARLIGLPARVFVPHGVGPAAVSAIRGEGALVVAVDDDYDAAVASAADASSSMSKLLVQDTSWAGYEQTPQWIVDGYSTIFTEIDGQLAGCGEDMPGMVAVPIGVGSLAQAAITHYRSRASSTHHTSVLGVEPAVAACAQTSLIKGEIVSLTTGPTSMAGLNCGTPSMLAWPYLRDGLDSSITVTDAESANASTALADLGVSSGPCGAASLAGARRALTGPGHQDRRQDLVVDANSVVVLLSTEGTR